MVPKKLMQKLESAEMSLSDVKQRYLLLHAFQNEFDELVGRRQISLLNDHVWQMVLDTRDALALHLASWTKGLTSPGGLLGEMKFSLSHLYVPSPDPGSRRPADRREVFERLFPEAVRRKKVLASDIDALAHAIKSIGTRVLNDRNQAIAHRYERHAKLGRRLLTPRGYGQVFQRLERLMNDVRVILDNSSRNGTMQQVLHDFGILDVDQIEPPYYWQLRDRFHTERRRRRKSSRARR